METEEFDDLFKSVVDKVEGKQNKDTARMDRLWNQVNNKPRKKPVPVIQLLAVAAILLLCFSTYLTSSYLSLKKEADRLRAEAGKDDRTIQSLNERILAGASEQSYRLDSLKRLIEVVPETPEVVTKTEYVYREKIVYVNREPRQVENSHATEDSLLNIIAIQREQLKKTTPESTPVRQVEEADDTEYLYNASIFMESPVDRELQAAKKPSPVKFNVSLFKRN